MGFTADTGITSDSDFEKVLAIQNVANLRTDGGSWANIHKEATNAIIRRLGPKMDPSKVTNTSVFREWAITWCAERIFREQGLTGSDADMRRSEMYRDALPRLWDEAFAAIELDTGSDGTADVRLGYGLPRVQNLGPARFGEFNTGMPGFHEAVRSD